MKRALFITVSLLLSIAASAQSYTAIDLGAFPAGSARVHDLNSSGQVVGASGHAHGSNTHAFFWQQKGGMRDLGTPFGGDYSVGFAINDAGKIVGALNTNRGMRAFLWQNGTGFKDLGSLPGQNSSVAYDINNAGQIVGVSGTHAVLWNGNTMQDLGTLGGATSEAHGINTNGQVVGVSESAEGPRAFLWSSNTMQNLGTLPGDTGSHADRVNDQGAVIGGSEGNAGNRAFLWTNDKGMQPLATLSGSDYSEAFGINNAGEIVGQSNTPLGMRAVVWTSPTQIEDLNDLVTGVPAGVVLTGAFAINDKGQIVAFGLVNPNIDRHQEVHMDQHAHAGPSHAFLLTPAGR